MRPIVIFLINMKQILWEVQEKKVKQFFPNLRFVTLVSICSLQI